MFESIVISSHKGPYSVTFTENGFSELSVNAQKKTHFFIDKNVASIYAKSLSSVLSSNSVLLLEANETSKTLDRIPEYVEHLVSKKVRRGDILVAVGGGIIQDITCFIAATLLRGLEWQYYPTTLLAQADSCIGSKSSINTISTKNLLGTFTPPSRIIIDTNLIDSLNECDVRSGVGEMLKIHIIDGLNSFKKIASDYKKIFLDKKEMVGYIRSSLLIKKVFIEKDEFDLGIRNVLNYGHSFGHAIEAATNFAIPHGIAVSMGMDIANFVSLKMEKLSDSNFHLMHTTLALNFNGYEKIPIPIEAFFKAINKDKKNTDEHLGLILAEDDFKVSRRYVLNDNFFKRNCLDYFEKIRMI